MNLYKYTIMNDGFGSKHTYYMYAKSLDEARASKKYSDDKELCTQHDIEITDVTSVTLYDLLDAVNVEDINNKVIKDYSIICPDYYI